MPRDEDEDLSAPRDLDPARPVPASTRGKPTQAKVGTRVPPVTTSPLSGLMWGVCGVTHQFGEMLSYSGSQGVIRFVSSGVSYTPPPVITHWRTVPSEPGRYEM